MILGTAYYPEQVNKDQWKQHFLLMAEAGIRRVRMAEFSWSTLCPYEGTFNWEWLDESISLASTYGLEVMLGTPTAVPPIWLIEKFPEVLPVNEEGQRMVFGKRQHRCYHAPAYRHYALELVRKMGERYGAHPSVVAWQIDNELGGERTRCYCSLCEIAFQDYLQQNFGSISDLNREWGTAFWSQTYQRFDQVHVPLRVDGQLWHKHNPGLELSFWRFSSDAITQFAGEQADILHGLTTKPVTTNTDSFYYGDAVCLPKLFEKVDVCSMDLYSKEPHEIAFYADLANSVLSKPFWMMEYSPTSPNLKMELDLLTRHNCAYTGLFSFLQFPWGQEQHAKALLTITGKTTPCYDRLRDWTANHHPAFDNNEGFSQVQVGLYYHFDSSWMQTMSNWLPHEEKWRYPRYLLHEVYKSLFDRDIGVRFVFDPSGIAGLSILLVPSHIMYDAQLEDALALFVANGGQLIVTDDLFTKTVHNAYMTELPRVYRVLFDWHGDDFPEMAALEVRSFVYEKGISWMLSANSNYAAWNTGFEKMGLFMR